jgi:hypothetical protein
MNCVHESLAQQSHGEHNQSFAWRIHSYVYKLIGNNDIADSSIFPKVDGSKPDEE